MPSVYYVFEDDDTAVDIRSPCISLISAWRASCQLNWTWMDYESNAQLFAMHLPSKMFVNFDFINSTQSKYGYEWQKMLCNINLNIVTKSWIFDWDRKKSKGF